VGTTTASPAAAGGSAFCANAERLVGALEDLPTVDLEEDRPRRRYFRRLDRIVGALEREAPTSLQGAFATLRPVYDLIAEDPDNVSLLLSERKARRALARLARYGERECGLELPTF
jgi:hypothetical protein